MQTTLRTACHKSPFLLGSGKYKYQVFQKVNGKMKLKGKLILELKFLNPVHLKDLQVFLENSAMKKYVWLSKIFAQN